MPGATDVSDPATDLGNPLWKHCLRNSYVPPFSPAPILSNLQKGQSSVPPESVFTASSSLWFGTVSNSEFGTFWCDLPLLPPILGQTWRHGSATIFFQRTSSRCTVLKCEFNGVIFPGGTFCSLTSPTATDVTQNAGAPVASPSTKLQNFAMPVWCLNSLVCAPPPCRGSIGPIGEDRLNFFYFAFLLPNHFSIQTFQFQTIMSPMNSVAVDVVLVVDLWMGKMFNITVKIFHESGIGSRLL